RLRRLVLVPQRRDLRLKRRWQRLEQGEEIPPLRYRLACRGIMGQAPRLLRGRYVAADCLAQIVNQADLDQPGEVDLGKLRPEHQRHQAEAPSVLGHAFQASRRGEAAAVRGLEPLRRTEEPQD